jgi:hypothetical protein
MSNLKSVGNKLFKTELANQKVDLALIDDLRKQANSSSKLNAESITLINKAISNYKESVSILNKVQVEAEKGYKLALELGLQDSIYKEFLDNVKSDILVNNKLIQKYS